MKKKLLIVVDYQNDFVSGSLGCPQAVAIEDALAAKIAAYRALGEGGQVIFTMDTHNKNYLETQEGRNLPIAHCIQATDGWPLYGKIRALKQEEDLVFSKPTFGSLELADYLSVERSALSNELSLMRRDGLIRYEKNHFDVMEQIETQHL